MARFKELQRDLVDRWRRIPDIDSGARDIVIVPSLSLAGLPMSNIPGITHYEERMLFALTLLKHPRTHLVYVTSQPLHPYFIDYLMSMLAGVPTAHARSRLTLLSAHDGSPRPLTKKILERPRLIHRIRQAIDTSNAHMTCFTVSPLERSLAVQLGVPLYGVDPDLLEIGTKSGSRRVFREAGIALPPGIEDVASEREVAEAIADLWEEHSELQRVVVKQDQGFSGQGNAVMSLGAISEVAPGAASRDGRVDRVLEALPDMRFATGESWHTFRSSLETLGGVVEAFVEGRSACSPSAQLRINPRSELEAVSTHDQMLGGPDGQTYEGCIFPADPAYRQAIQRDALAVGRVLVDRGVIGRVAVDYVAVERDDQPGAWDQYAIEINLRMTGTTHPMMLMGMLTEGHYDPDSGLYCTRRGDPRYYMATDTMSSDAYQGLLVEDLLDIAAVHKLHYVPWTETGIVFHLMGSLSQFGKLGITAIGASPAEAQQHFDAVRETLDRETDPAHPAQP